MFSIISENYIEEYAKNYPLKSKFPKEYGCLSTDEKETEGIANGSTLIEMDTGKVYIFDRANSMWRKL